MKIVKKLVCPRCSCEEFLQGPSAGASFLAKCDECGYVINVTMLAATAGPGTTAPALGFLVI